MSIASQQRHTKRPTSTVNSTHVSQPYLHPIPQKSYSLHLPGNKKFGAFGGCTVSERRRRKEAKKEVA